MDLILEVIGFTLEGCLTAQRAGADRIELCDGPGEGGTTPSYGMIKAARKKLDISLYPMIRPRGGDFLYSDEEFQVMLADVSLCKSIGCDGIVTGLLKPGGSVDVDRCNAIVQMAYPMGVTFHRAFDRVKDPFEALEDVINCGFERILTSGLQQKAVDGIALIRSLIQKADERITIMPGSGINAVNIKKIATGTGAIEFHSSARIAKQSLMTYSNSEMNETLSTISVDEQEIQNMKNILSALSKETA